MTDIASTLQERGNRYGVFAEHANITQRLKMVMYDTPKFSELENDQIEALDMIAHKIGRILNGDPNYADSWVDIAGYAKLVADRLEKREIGIDQQARDFAHLEPEFRHDLGGAEADEERAGIIALNGNEGDHYREAMNWKQIGEEMKETLKPYIEAARKAQDDGWIEWKGGKCPVGEGDELLVMNRDGHIYRGCGQEGYWQHDGKHYDIIKYKLIGKFSAGRGDDDEVQA